MGATGGNTSVPTDNGEGGNTDRGILPRATRNSYPSGSRFAVRPILPKVFHLEDRVGNLSLYVWAISRKMDFLTVVSTHQRV